VSTTPPVPQMDVLYLQNYNGQFYGHVLGAFTRNAAPTQIEATADNFVGTGAAAGLVLRAPVATNITVSFVSQAAGVAAITIQVNYGDLPQIDDLITVAGTHTNSPEFNVTANITQVDPAGPTISYAVPSGAAAVASGTADVGTVTVLYPQPADFVIPSTYIGLFSAPLIYKTLVSPFDYAVYPTTGAPVGVKPPMGGPVTVAVSPPNFTITSPSGLSGVLILFVASGSAPVPITPPISTSSPNTYTGALPATLTPGTTYRAVVFVPGSPMVVSGSFTD
jgi:hypothetical protein